MEKMKKMIASIVVVIIVIGGTIYIKRETIRMEIQSIKFRYETETVRKKMKDYLAKHYDDEVILGGITKDVYRDSYRGLAYPKGKKGDSYYYGDVEVQAGLFELGAILDDYGPVATKKNTINYLKPRVEELFGDKVALKVEPTLVFNGRSYVYSVDLVDILEGKKDVKEDEHIELTMDLYVFDLIDNQQEKQEYKEKIFALVNYFKEKDLFEYLELGVYFIDSRFFAPSHEGLSSYLAKCPTVEHKVGDDKIYLPAEKYQKWASNILQTEIDNLTNQDLKKKINDLHKDKLDYETIRKENGQYFSKIRSEGMLRREYPIIYDKLKENNELAQVDYDNITEIWIAKNSQYIYDSADK